MGCLSVTSDRAQVVDYTYPHFINSVTFTSPKAQHKLYSVSLISPFDTKIWICFVISVTLLTVICLLSERLLKENFDFIWILLTILLKQSLNKSSNYGSLSTLLLVWIFACFVLTTIYGGCLHSHMSLIREQNSIETIEELVKAQTSGRIDIIITKGTALHSFIMVCIFFIEFSINSLFQELKAWCLPRNKQGT